MLNKFFDCFYITDLATEHLYRLRVKFVKYPKIYGQLNHILIKFQIYFHQQQNENIELHIKKGQ